MTRPGIEPTVARLLIAVLATCGVVAGCVARGDELTGDMEKLPAAAVSLKAAELPVVAIMLLIAELPVAELPVAELPVAELPAAEMPAAELPAAELLSVEFGRDAWARPEGVTLHMLQRKQEEGVEETDRSSPARGTWTK
jgi:hypothetical protein